MSKPDEPVLWEMPDGKVVDKWGLRFYSGQKGTPLYTRPQPKREWVGLTDDEDDDCACKADEAHSRNNHYAWAQVYRRTIEAKLKEKNT